MPAPNILLYISGKIFSHMFSDMLELFSRLRIP